MNKKVNFKKETKNKIISVILAGATMFGLIAPLIPLFSLSASASGISKWEAGKEGFDGSTVYYNVKEKEGNTGVISAEDITDLKGKGDKILITDGNTYTWIINSEDIPDNISFAHQVTVENTSYNEYNAYKVTLEEFENRPLFNAKLYLNINTSETKYKLVKPGEENQLDVENTPYGICLNITPEDTIKDWIIAPEEAFIMPIGPDEITDTSSVPSSDIASTEKGTNPVIIAVTAVGVACLAGIFMLLRKKSEKETEENNNKE